MAGTKSNPKCKTCGRYLMEMTVGKTVGQICLVCHTSSFPTPCPHPWRPYPILNVSRRSMAWQTRWPTSMPWGLLWPHETQAQENHGQSLERLSQRGGLDPVEMVKIIEGTAWRTGEKEPPLPVAMERLRAYRIHWMRRNRNQKGR